MVMVMVVEVEVVEAVEFATNKVYSRGSRGSRGSIRVSVGESVPGDVRASHDRAKVSSIS